MTFRQGKSLVTSLTVQRTLLRVLCAFVLCGILVAGLWPFHAPKNEVKWLSNENGVVLGEYGSLLSARGFQTSNSLDGACLEIWLQPRALHGWGTILSFYPPEHRSTLFALRQSGDGLALQRKDLDENRSTRSARIYVAHIFRQGKPVFLTMSSGEQGTSIYLNGVLVRMFGDFRFSNQDLTGQLVVGNSSITADTWSGQLKGFAIYNRELRASQVNQHYESWLGNGHPGMTAPDRAVASYLFNEGVGDVVHDQVNSANDLVIPERFFVLHEQFLERPWNEYYPGWHYWEDIGVNVAGFIPLGFFFCAYFLVVRRVEHPAAVTVVFGLAVSLVIEVLQAFLPTRYSGMTDLITNALGTAIGAIAFRHRAFQLILAKTALYTKTSSVPSTMESEVDMANQQEVDEKEMHAV